MNTLDNFKPITHTEKLTAITSRDIGALANTVTREVDGTTFELRYRFNPPPVDHGNWNDEDWVKYIDGPDGVWEWTVQA